MGINDLTEHKGFALLNGKESLADAGDMALILGWNDPLEGEMATHSSILAWVIPWTEEPGGYSQWHCKESDTTDQLSTHAKILFQFSSIAQSCPTVCDPMDYSMPNFSVHHQLPELAQTNVYRVDSVIQPSHPLLFPSLSDFNLSQH